MNKLLTTITLLCFSVAANVDDQSMIEKMRRIIGNKKLITGEQEC